jgi:hypothetical protein
MMACRSRLELKTLLVVQARVRKLHAQNFATAWGGAYADLLSGTIDPLIADEKKRQARLKKNRALPRKCLKGKPRRRWVPGRWVVR